ncbi:MAG: ABC transporter permease [Defluviitaleaceae bacterium]|nr:ABC transporter permease [Defluviitaleaceae bacterium]
MKQNIFMKSVLRQPVKTGILAVLMLVASFAFVARVVEFIVVHEEIGRIESLYYAVGILAPILPNDITASHDVTEAAALIGASELVRYEDRRPFVQGVMSDIMNVTSQIRGVVPHLHGLDIETMEVYFYGMVRQSRTSPHLLRMDVTYLILDFEAEGLIMGDERMMPTENRVTVTASGRVIDLNRRLSLMLPLTDAEADAFEAGTWSPIEGMTEDGIYMFRAAVAAFNRGQGHDYFLRPLVGNDGARGWWINENYRDENLIWFAPISDREMLEHIYEQMTLAYENLRSFTVIGTKDMANVPRFTNPVEARLLQQPAGGRFLTVEDYENRNHVAVVTAQMAARKGLTLGQTFTITLNSNERPYWIDNPGHFGGSWFVNGIEGAWANMPQGWWGTTESREDVGARESVSLELEVVGVYFNTPSGIPSHNFLHTEIYIPASLIPEGFGWTDAPLLTGMYSFILDSPRDVELFIQNYSSQLARLGFTPRFLENGFDAFAGAADTIVVSITVNLAIFILVSLLILFLVIFLYIREWKRAVAISRALGAPAGQTLRKLFTPVVAIWTPAIIIGAVAAWIFALAQAGVALGELQDVAGILDPNVPVHALAHLGITYDVPLEPRIADVYLGYHWLAIMAGGMAIAALASLGIAGSVVTRKPVLEQLQGGAQVKVKKPQNNQRVDPGELPTGFVLGAVNISHEPLKTTKGGRRTAAFRHIKRHIFRSPLKSTLAAVVALFFVVSLGWLDNTITTTGERIDYLWANTVVSAQVRPALDEEQTVTEEFFRHANISAAVARHMLNIGWAQSVYMEALWWFSTMRSQEYFDNRQEPLSIWGGETFIIGINDFYGFLEENTRTALDDALGVLGSNIEVTFLEGFGSDDFEFFGPDVPTPVIVRASYFYEMGYSLGDILVVSNMTTPMQAQVIGVFEYGVQRGVNRWGDEIGTIIMPLNALHFHTYDHFMFDEQGGWGIGGLLYMTLNLEINPNRNRNLTDIYPLVNTVLTQNDLGRFVAPIPLELVLHDGELRMAIEPLESNLALMQLLYPIAIAVAAILSVGMSMLIMLQNAKAAAIMRVLGKPKGKSQLTLCGEQVFVTMTGVATGILALFVIGVAAFEPVPLGLAGMYFAGAVIGSAVGAFVISAKTPLELLQVRE